jgi:uncharacterized membrane protein
MRDKIFIALLFVICCVLSWASQIQLKWGLFLGPFHVVILHFPMVLVMIVAVLEVAWYRNGGEELRRIIYRMTQASVVSTLVTVGLGILLVQPGGYNVQVMEEHKNYGLVVMWVSVIAMGLLTWERHKASARVRNGFRGLLVVIILLMPIVGHSGGKMTHGTEFFLKNAPVWIKNWFEGEPDTNGGDNSFKSEVWPILEARCIKCHGPDKDKGDLRVDDRESLLIGGETEEPALVPGDPAASSLIRVILLPQDHEELMPPKGKGRVTAEEVTKLINWIQNGGEMPNGFQSE